MGVMGIISGWKPAIISGAICFAVGTGGGWIVNGWRLEIEMRDAVAAAKSEVKNECDKAQKTTEDISNDNQKRLESLNARYSSAMLRVRELDARKQCVYIANAPSGHDGSTTGNGNAGPYAVPAESFIDYGADAEKIQSRLIACQDFIKKERNR